MTLGTSSAVNDWGEVVLLVVKGDCLGPYLFARFIIDIDLAADQG